MTMVSKTRLQSKKNFQKTIYKEYDYGTAKQVTSAVFSIIYPIPNLKKIVNCTVTQLIYKESYSLSCQPD